MSNGYKMSKNEHEEEDFENENISEYDELELLERLETLREDMEELGVKTLTEVIQRIEQLHKELDQH